MTVHELHELIEKLDKTGYAEDEVREGLAKAEVLWVFPTQTGVELKSALSFTADDLKVYAEEYYMTGDSPYKNDEEFVEHLMDAGIQQDTVQEALGEAWSNLYFKVLMRGVSNNVKEESK